MSSEVKTTRLWSLCFSWSISPALYSSSVVETTESGEKHDSSKESENTSENWFTFLIVCVKKIRSLKTSSSENMTSGKTETASRVKEILSLLRGKRLDAWMLPLDCLLSLTSEEFPFLSDGIQDPQSR